MTRHQPSNQLDYKMNWIHLITFDIVYGKKKQTWSRRSINYRNEINWFDEIDMKIGDFDDTL